MLVKYKYNYVSAEPVWAQVKEELQSYFESNAINDSMFPKYTEDLIRKLGYSALVVKEEIGILEQDEIERAFYEEPTKPNFGYRRGISL